MTGALHDVSNALTVLLGWVAEARGTSSAEAIQHALAIVEERARAARAVARRAIGADVDLDEGEMALDEVVADVVEALSVEAQRAGVTLAVAGRASAVLVTAPGDLTQILTNVVLNALAWSPRGSRVTVEPEADSVEARVFVQDAGPGVPAAQVPFVFDGASTRDGGAGVGLRHARAVARAAGGDLALTSTRAGEAGARFQLRWPRVEATLPRAPVSAPRATVLAGTRVLVVEDDADVASLLESALGARGAEVVVASTAEELHARAKQRIDAALIDLSPIAHDVGGAVAALRGGSPDVALVFISGSAVGLPEGLEGDAIRWVRKPFEVAEVVSALIEVRAASRRAGAG